MTSTPTPHDELTEEEIQKRLAGESLRGPRTFRDRLLAPLSHGLRDLRDKVTAPNDTGRFFDVGLLHILAEAYGKTKEEMREKRFALMAATDHPTLFRTTISLLMDEFSDEDFAEARRLVNDILGIVEKAEVILAEKKSDSEEQQPAELSQTTTPSTSGPSPGSPAGTPTTSDGNCP